MSQFTVTAVWEKAKALAEAHPDAIYRPPDPVSCNNLKGDVWVDKILIGHGCIVGQAIVALNGGTAPDLLTELSGEGVDGLITHSLLFEDSSPHFHALETMQSEQDSGKPWGVALTEAMDWFEYEPETATVAPTGEKGPQ